VAVESDGAAYRSARTARDRDRLRGEVLASLGWHVERVWSSSWWFDDRTPARLVERVRTTLALPPPGRPPAPPEPPPPPPEVVTAAAVPPAADRGSVTALAGAPPYRIARLPPAAGSAEAFFDLEMDDRIVADVLAVAEAEGPVHEKLLARRVAAHWGVARLTARPLRRVAEALQRLAQDGKVLLDGEFVWPASVDRASYAGFRAAPDGEEAPRELGAIPPEEVANAAAAILRDSGSLDRDALGREIARLFGISRMGANVRECVDRGMEVLVASERAEVRGDRVQLKAR
jgi:hypothetical protein